MMHTLVEPPREIPIADEVDVLVVGGGPAGIAAATAAARLGARTMLVERYGYLGGLASGGLVLVMCGVFDPQGERRIDGLFWEMMQRLGEVDGLAEESPTRLHVDSEWFKIVADELCIEAGVVLRLHSWAVDALVEGERVKGAIVESKSGRQAILARVCVDASGDGDVAARAGAAYDMRTMRIGLDFKVGGVDLAAYHAWRKAHPEQASALRDEVRAQGGCPLGAGATPYSDQGVYWVNVLGLANREGTAARQGLPGGVFAGELSALDVQDLTFAEVELRRQIAAGLDFYRRNVPGYRDVRLLAIASELGVRDSRRVRGVHPLTRTEIEEGVGFADVVGMTGAVYGGHPLQVPYRALVPETLEGLLVSGRCISVDDGLIHDMRVIPPCMLTGQAAGTAAALSLQAGVALRALDPARLRAQLAADGVLLP
jgi:hypothetical protein